MSEIYNRDYYLQYDVGIGKVNYADSAYTKDFLEGIARRIVEDLHPKTVLDAGCAMGHLVAALRDCGVEAYGIDISEYAISQVREDVRPYCAVGSLVDPLPKSLPPKYDVVVTIEVLEHLRAEDGKKAIKNLCSLTDCIIFCSTPDDFADPTHLNVQQREYWARLFAEQGFYDDLSYRPTFLTHYASCFRRTSDTLSQIEDYERYIRLAESRMTSSDEHWAKAVEDKERHIQNQKNIIEDKERHIQNQKTIIEDKERHIQNQNVIIADAEQQNKTLQESLRKANSDCQQLSDELALVTEGATAAEAELETANRELEHYKTHYFAAINQREELKAHSAQLQLMYDTIANSASWKLTKPLRVVLDGVKRLLKSNRYTYLFCKGLKCLIKNGFRYTWRKVKDKLRHRQSYSALAGKPLFTEEELEAQRHTVFPQNIKFSVVVPLYNTPEKFLHEMIRSVLDQTYSNWELCMADGSDGQHTEVEQICRAYARKDSRVKYRRLEKNLGISGNTNACLEMSTGDYIALFDHDDLLHPAALHEVMRAICEQGADFIYTDENTFHDKPEDAYTPHFKPDFAPDSLRSCNYICHLTTFKKALLEKSGGGLRSEFDGSQDYDLILRLTEQAERIVHIPKILYYWRAHRNSTAADVAAKPYVLDAARRALAEHLERIGLRGRVCDSIAPSTYRIQYEVPIDSLVSILIPNKDHVDDLKTCIDSIKAKTTYPLWEIVVIENNSTEQQTFWYYDEIQQDERIRVVHWKNEFNYSAINNFGAKNAKGKYLLLLNNDVEIITPDWIEQMLMFAQRDDVGAVGAMLYYPDDTIQHAGVIVGLGGVAGHSHKYFPRKELGYMCRLTFAQNYSAVTAACMMVRRDVWENVGGLDESFGVAFNDVDLCMRIRKAGYLIVWTPFAELYHYESKSRGLEDTPEKQKRFEGEILRFRERWRKELDAGDPYYNPNFTLDREDFSLR